MTKIYYYMLRLHLLLCVLIIGQIIAIYFLYEAVSTVDKDGIHLRLQNRFTISAATFKEAFKSIDQSFSEITQVLQLVGQLPAPALFAKFIQSSVELASYRWIPRILQADRQNYEAYGKIYYDSNFTIRDISFINGSFKVSPSPVKAFYYPLTISVPPFTLTSMGGDFLANSSVTDTFKQSLLRNGTITGERVGRSTPDRLTNYGMYITRLVYNESGNGNGNGNSLMGVLQAVMIPSNIMVRIPTTLRLNRDYTIYIFDSVTDNLIYNSQEQVITKCEFASKNRYLYRTEVNIYNRTLLIAYEYSDSYVSSLTSQNPIYILIIATVSCLLIDMALVFAEYMYYKRLIETKADTNRKILMYMDHELRNPLHALNNLILLMIGTMRQTKTTLPAEEFSDSFEIIISDLYTMKGHILLMNSIVNDVHIVQQLGASMVVITLSPIDLTSFVHELNTTVRAKIMEIGEVEYVKNVPDNLFFLGDSEKLSQILIKLLDNAIKHTQRGSITLTISPRGKNLHFEIKDTGVGIDSSAVATLFFNSDIALIGSQPVTGVGLFISKSLVQLMGGDIGYCPNPLGGSVFWFTIPYRQGPLDGALETGESDSLRITVV